MLDENKIIVFGNIFSDHQYIMTTAQLHSEKLYYVDIQLMLKEGLIEKMKRGDYHWVEDPTGNEVLIINRLFPDGILCMETALFYYGYSDRNPAQWNPALSKNVSKERTKIDYPFIKAYRMEPSLLSLGETTGEMDFTTVHIYDRERTICDVLRNMNKIDKEVFNQAIQGYVKDTKKNITNLMKYAHKLHVQKRVKDLIGVWL